MYDTSHLGIIIGPYGGIGYAGKIQREDLEQVAKTCVGLFRWAKRLLCKLL